MQGISPLINFRYASSQADCFTVLPETIPQADLNYLLALRKPKPRKHVPPEQHFVHSNTSTIRFKDWRLEDSWSRSVAEMSAGLEYENHNHLFQTVFPRQIPYGLQKYVSSILGSIHLQYMLIDTFEGRWNGPHCEKSVKVNVCVRHAPDSYTAFHADDGVVIAEHYYQKPGEIILFNGGVWHSIVNGGNCIRTVLMCSVSDHRRANDYHTCKGRIPCVST